MYLLLHKFNNLISCSLIHVKRNFAVSINQQWHNKIVFNSSCTEISKCITNLAKIKHKKLKESKKLTWNLLEIFHCKQTREKKTLLNEEQSYEKSKTAVAVWKINSIWLFYERIFPETFTNNVFTCKSVNTVTYFTCWVALNVESFCYFFRFCCIYCR